MKNNNNNINFEYDNISKFVLENGTSGAIDTSLSSIGSIGFDVSLDVIKYRDSMGIETLASQYWVLTNSPGGTDGNGLLYYQNGNVSIDYFNGYLRNTFNNNISIDYGSGLLNHIDGNATVDYQNYLLYNGGNLLMNWSTGLTYDYYHKLSFDWLNRYLYDNSANLSIDWGNRKLCSINGTEIVDWNSSTSGLQYQADYSSNYTDRSLIDFGFLKTYVSSTSGILYDQFEIPSIDYYTRLLLDSSGNTTFDYNNGYLYYNNLLIADLQGQELFDNNGNLAFRFNTTRRDLLDSSVNVSIDYQDRLLYSGSNQSLDWNNRFLLDGASNPTLQWTNYLLKDSSTNTSLDWNNRLLYASDGITIVANWSNSQMNMTLVNYASNALAISGGLVAGDLYQNTGIVQIVY